MALRKHFCQKICSETVNPFFMEILLLYVSQKTKCVVFQNSKSIVTFDQYFN